MSVESLLESLSNYAVGSYAYDSAVGGIKDLFEKQEQEIETLRMQLSACGVAALANTRETAAAQRVGREHPYWSDSYQLVIDAVDREMRLREEHAETKETLEHARLQGDLTYMSAELQSYRHVVEVLRGQAIDVAGRMAGMLLDNANQRAEACANLRVQVNRVLDEKYELLRVGRALRNAMYNVQTIRDVLAAEWDRVEARLSIELPAKSATPA